MIVQHQQFRIKPGCVDEAIELMQEMWKLGDPIPHRIYRGIVFDILIQGHPSDL